MLLLSNMLSQGDSKMNAKKILSMVGMSVVLLANAAMADKLECTSSPDSKVKISVDLNSNTLVESLVDGKAGEATITFAELKNVPEAKKLAILDLVHADRAFLIQSTTNDQVGSVGDYALLNSGADASPNLQIGNRMFHQEFNCTKSNQ
jgi:hypothetical protein